MSISVKTQNLKPKTQHLIPITNLKATYHKYILEFKRPSGTSRGVMNEKEMLSMYFVHEGSVRADPNGEEWRLKRHAEADFWRSAPN